MTVRRGDRDVGVVLSVGTVVALAVGGWWWADSAPEPGPVTASVPSASVPPPDSSFDSYVVLDAVTGAVVGGVGGPVPSPQPDPVRRTVLRVDENVNQAAWWVQARIGGRYLLEYECDGQGPVTVRVEGAQGRPTAIACGEGSARVELDARAPHLTISLAGPTTRPGPAAVTLRLTTLS
ncbi:hypothetical protein ACI2K4_33780 [Micromonospora sp. NPDC050397]|uniref:hypothetical protein n=1 Tax=Micromonospora sp. NPDC050397 TaxID=3364279 RepID=UPI00384A6E33